MAEALAPDGIRFVFIYAREAHPSDRYPGHRSFEQKLEHARAMVGALDLKRPMLVDDLTGTLHQAYGRLPNMAYIVKPGGRIYYRASWTDPRSLRAAIDELSFERDERRGRRRTMPFYLEWMPHRSNERAPFLEGLAEVGPRAVEEYIAATAHLDGEAAAKPLRDWWAERKDAKA